MGKVSPKTSLSNAVVKLFRKVNRAHNRALSKFDLTAEQVHILSILWSNGKLTIGELQKEVSLSSGTIAGAIDRMEKRKLIMRIKNPNDKRVTFIQVAELGKKNQLAIEKSLLETEEKLFGKLTNSEREMLIKLTNNVID